MKNNFDLPKSYKKILEVDLKKNHKLSLLIGALALFIGIAMLVPVFIYSRNNFVKISEINMPIMILITVVGVIACVSLCKFMRGFFIRIFSDKKDGAAFDDCYLNRKNYIIVSLAPIVILGIILAVINFAVPSSWFFVVYIIQTVNVANGAANYFFILKLMELPSDILIKNKGTVMTVFNKKD